MNVSDNDVLLVNTLVPLLSPVFIPMLGNLLSNSYNWLNNAAAVVSVNFQKMEEEIEARASKCWAGCLTWCSRKK